MVGSGNLALKQKGYCPPHAALRRLRSIPSRPSHTTVPLAHAGIARLRRRSLAAALRAASISLSAAALLGLGENGGGERWRWFPGRGRGRRARMASGPLRKENRDE